MEYSLTDLGKSLAKTIGVLDKWVVDNYYAVAEARKPIQQRDSD